jgi:elongator complex protein 4
MSSYEVKNYACVTCSTRLPAASADLGTRAGLHSQTLISTGLADLDRILGGGLPLGSILLLLSDPFTPHCATLLRYFVAEGVACSHSVHWAAGVTPDPAALPRLAQARGTSRTQVRHGTGVVDCQRMQALETFMRAAAKQEEEEEQGAAEDPQLRIAWQYRRYIQRQRQQQSHSAVPAEPPPAVLGIPAHVAGRQPPTVVSSSAQPPRANSSSSSKGGMRDWAHSFDLSRGMDAGAALQGGCLTCAGHRGPEALGDLLQGARSLLARLQQPPGAFTAPAATTGPPAPPQARWALLCAGGLLIRGLQTWTQGEVGRVMRLRTCLWLFQGAGVSGQAGC